MYKAWAIKKRGMWRIEFEIDEGLTLLYLCSGNKILKFNSKQEAENHILNHEKLELWR